MPLSELATVGCVNRAYGIPRRNPQSLLIYVALVILLAFHQVQCKRWMNPCGATGSPEDASVDIFSHTGRNHYVRSLQALEVNLPSETLREVTDSLQLMLDRLGSLRRKVKELKDLYVEERFREPSIIEDFERIGLRIEGMPIARDVTASTLANINLISSIHKAFEDMARIAVFLDQARLGETLSKVDRVSFATFFRRLENDNDHGIYWHLCSLYRLVIQLPHPQLDPEAVRSVQGLRVTDVDSVAVRHTRDFIVLRDTDRTLEQISVDFGALVLMYRQK